MKTIADEIGPLARSLWTDTAPAAPSLPSLEGDLRADVAIVGAGFTGLSAAIHLAERGADVVVLEAQSPGWGASGRNGGQVIAGLKEDPDTIEQMFGREVGERIVRFSDGAPDVVFDLIERHAIDCDAVRTGWIQPAHDAQSRRVLESRAEQWSRRGAPVSLLDRDETARLVGTQIYKCAAIDRRGGSIHPLKYVLGLADAALRLGVRLHGHSRVTSMEREGGGHRLNTAAGSVTAGQVLLCTNGYTDGAFDRLRRSVVPVCSVQVATEPLSDNVRATILPEGQVASDMRRLLVYYRLTHEGRIVMGGRGAYGQSAIETQQERLKQLTHEMFPQIGAVRFTHHWGGYVAMTADHFPHLHETVPGVVAALGYNGRGVAMASAMGKLLARKLAGDAGLDYPTTPVSPIPLHGFRKTGVSLLVAWNGWRDRVDRA